VKPCELEDSSHARIQHKGLSQQLRKVRRNLVKVNLESLRKRPRFRFAEIAFPNADLF